MDVFVINHLAPSLPDLARCVMYRSNVMCSVYPADGTRYVRHVDNPNQNGRKVRGVAAHCRRFAREHTRALTCALVPQVTAIVYLNEGWRPADGGECRVFTPE
jgi:hypothetical protein